MTLEEFIELNESGTKVCGIKIDENGISKVVELASFEYANKKHLFTVKYFEALCDDLIKVVVEC